MDSLLYNITNIDLLKVLINSGADVNTTLIWVSYHGRTEIVKLLLAAGANVDVVGSDDNTALIYASENGHTEVIKLLLAAGADVDRANNDGKTALMIASQYGHANVVELLEKK